MRFDVISILPDLLETVFHFGVIGSAFQKGLCHLHIHNPRSFAKDVHQSVDDRPFGGGDGMLMMAEPLQLCLENVGKADQVIFLSPQGDLFDDSMAKSLSRNNRLTLICGRYGGVDNRFLIRNKIREVSIGNYVLSGGELGASVMMDAIVRHIPGVLGHACSATQDSFNKNLLEAPGFTRPQNWRGQKVPEILLLGDHAKIQEYRQMVSIVITLLKRPELLEDQKIPWNKVYEYFQKCRDQDLVFCNQSRDEILKEIRKKENTKNFHQH